MPHIRAKQRYVGYPHCRVLVCLRADLSPPPPSPRAGTRPRHRQPRPDAPCLATLKPARLSHRASASPATSTSLPSPGSVGGASCCRRATYRGRCIPLAVGTCTLRWSWRQGTDLAWCSSSTNTSLKRVNDACSVIQRRETDRVLQPPLHHRVRHPPAPSTTPC
jgi:hypothetical protein